jgi:EAL domain-containing protein (putative c-di-GMP-specific phosphodiesterase class I)/DNA-binding LacI/PurR family transcriptional regulator/GGDEF domain-containing protein
MVIGVCLSELHNLLNTGYVAELDRAARKAGGELIVFNSSLDFHWYEKDSRVARSIFNAIEYRLFAGLVIISNSFHDEELFDQIVADAAKQHVPVISVGQPHAGCYNIVNDPETAMKSLLRHVIGDHGARDTFFIAGREGEENSEFRLRCYKEVLAEFGLPFRQENVAWGKYWAQPAAAITLQLIREREKPPRAIFCANDVMAIAVCDTLKENGYRVPEDVIVTGFDGTPAASLVNPRLTTVGDNQEELADATVDLIRRLSEGEQAEHTLTHPFRPVFSESCGCRCEDSRRYDALAMLRMLEAEHEHENQLYHTVERMLMQTDPKDFARILSHSLPANSAVCLNKSCLKIYEGQDYASTEIEEELIRIPQTVPPEEPELQDTRLHRNSPVSRIRSGVTLVNAIHSDTAVFGYFSAQTQNLRQDSQLLKRLSDVLNLVFTIQLGNMRQRNLMSHIEQSQYQDSLTGLANLKGLTQWFSRFESDPDSHRLCIALSVYEIGRYSYIYETSGIEETETVVRRISSALAAANPEAAKTARISENQFVVFDCAVSDSLLRRKIESSAADFYRMMESYNAENDKNYFVEIHSGYTTMTAGWSAAGLANLIRLATGEMYLNRLRFEKHEAVKDTKITAELYNTFSLLMEKDLFRYHFQPIVDAKTGQIFAYEALMRTDSLIDLSPLQILAVAREYNRLYDVERTTIFGIIERYVRDFSAFNGAKVFINTIPGHFLDAADCAELAERFAGYLDCFVFELTEQDTTSDGELARLKHLCKPGSQTIIAIDDYGTGHSNMVNVLRYNPQIIKIDRELIAGIEGDSNKQLFVRNTIDFAHQNGIKALAEGVETLEELRTVISFGIDLIQGFYTGRPADRPLQELPENIRRVIAEENVRLASYDNDRQSYSARNGEVVDLFDLAIHQYTYLNIPEGTVTLRGRPGVTVDMTVRTAPDAESTLILDNADLKGNSEPALLLGNGSTVILELRNQNALRKDGIRVPGGASLTVTGKGDLLIDSTRNYSSGIGGNFNDSYGSILFDLEGRLDVRVSGDKAVCVGGRRSAGSGIVLRRGDVSLIANGINVLGMGSASGNAEIRLESGRLQCQVHGNDGVGIGTLTGCASLESSADLDVTTYCERSIGIGTQTGDMGLRFTGGSVLASIHCDVGACVGNLTGEGTVLIRGANVRIHGEGNLVAGFGSVSGACDTRVESGGAGGELLAARRLLLGNENSRMVITGGNIQLFPENEKDVPVSPDGTPLVMLAPEGGSYERTFKDKRAVWNYRAVRSQDGRLNVWIPPEA